MTANVARVQAVDNMSVGELKKTIKEMGLSIKGCVEKKDLQKRAKEGISAKSTTDQKRKKKGQTGKPRQPRAAASAD